MLTEARPIRSDRLWARLAPSGVDLMDETLIPAGPSTPDDIDEAGAVFVVAPGSRVETTNAPAVTLSEDDSALRNAGELVTSGASTVLVKGDDALVLNEGGSLGGAVRVTVESLVPGNGGVVTPVWVALHDGGFDAFDEGAPASTVIERLAEEGVTGLEPTVPGLLEALAEAGFDSDLLPPPPFIAQAFGASPQGAGGGVQGIAVDPGSPLGIFPGGAASTRLDLTDGTANAFLSYGAMFIPSNDAFIGNDDPTARPIFDAKGNFTGTSFVVEGSEVWDAGTELNEETPGSVPLGAEGFLMGTPEGGTVERHPGLAPPGSGGVLDLPPFADADFAAEGFEVARITVEAAGVALIESDETAVEIRGQDAAIRNSGVISGDFNGVSFVNGGESSGSLVNHGLITSESRAVNIGGSGVEVINSGRIQTTASPRDGVIYSDRSADDYVILNEETGTIGLTGDAVGAALSLQLGEDVEFAVRNHGHVEAAGEHSGIRVWPGVPGASAEGTILNTSAIRSEATAGIQAGVLIEPGVDFEGLVLNEGLISGNWNGIYVGLGHHDLTIRNEGRIESASRAVNLDGTGVVLENTGEIVTMDDPRNGAIYSNVTADGFAIRNHGLIDAGEGQNGDAVSLELDEAVSAEIHNTGEILGRGEAMGSGQASGVRLFSVTDGSKFTGNIHNEGLISSEATAGISAGVLVENGVSFHGSIQNEGTIEGPRHGIYVGEGEHDLRIVNEGLILSASRAVNIDGSGVELTNRGDIRSDGDPRDGVVYTDATADDFSIVNEKGGVIAVDDGFEGHGVSLQLGARVDGEVRNDGLIQGRGEDAGLRLFSGVEGRSVFDGPIVNTGTIAAEEGASIRIEAHVVVRDAIVNAGALEGALALDAAAMTTGLRFDQREGTSEGAFLFGSGRDRFLGGDGAEVVDGGLGRDVIEGGGGGDRLDGGGGIFDRLTGGEDADVFVFDDQGDGSRDVARITDFEAGLDALELGAEVARSFETGRGVTLIFEGGDRDVLLIDDVSIADLAFL
jgi:hypothetical protein